MIRHLNFADGTSVRRYGGTTVISLTNIFNAILKVFYLFFIFNYLFFEKNCVILFLFCIFAFDFSQAPILRHIWTCPNRRSWFCSRRY